MTETFWLEQAAFPVLAALQLLPLLAAGLVWALHPWRGAAHLGRLAALVELALAGYLYRCFDVGGEGLQLAERLDFFGPFNYHAAADGVTVLFVMLAAFLVVVVSLYGSLGKALDQGRFMTLLLAGEASVMAALTTLNLFWFAVAMVAEAVLVGALLWQGLGPAERGRLQARYFQFQGIGLLLLLLGVLLAGWSQAVASGGAWSFDLLDLVEAPVPDYLGSIIFFLLFYGLAVRTPLFPMHGWLPTLLHQGNVAVAPALLLGIKLGLYGMVRFVMPVVPEAVAEWHWYVAGFAAAGVFYAALQVSLQSDLRRSLAFVALAQTGLVVISLFSLRPQALTGGMLLAAMFSLAMLAVLVTTGLIRHRVGSTRLARLGGTLRGSLLPVVTFLAGGLLLIGWAGPGGLDVGRRAALAAMKTFGTYPVAAVVLANVLAVAFLLYGFLRGVLAPAPARASVPGPEESKPLEHFIAVLLLLALGGTLAYPGPWQSLLGTAMRALAANFS